MIAMAPRNWLLDAADLLSPRLDPNLARYREDPVAWMQDELGLHLWSKQREIVRSVRDNRMTMVPACCDIGKSFIAARTMAWWNVVHPNESIVVSTAPTFAQVRAILWRELRRAARASDLPGELNQTEWSIGGDLVAIGRKPADHDPAAFQGLHARYVLVVFDEADGIHTNMWDAAMGLITNANSRMLAIGNTDDPWSEFRQRCQPDSGCHVVQVDGLESPLITGEWVPQELRELLISPIWIEEVKRMWGEDDPRYRSKVRGQWTDGNDEAYQIIPDAWVRAAQERWTGEPNTPMVALGVDVARGGRDEMVCAPLHEGWHYGSLSTAKGKAIDDGRKGSLFVRRVVVLDKQTPIAIDSEGVGTSPRDQLKQAGYNVLDIIAGSSAPTVRRNNQDVPIVDPSGQYQYANLRSYMWFTFRDMLDPREGRGIMLPPGDEIRRQLTAPCYRIKSRGDGVALQVEGKDEIKKRISRSTDHADGIIQAAYAYEQEERKRMAQASAKKRTVQRRRGRWKQ